MNLKNLALLFVVSAATGTAGFYAGVIRETNASRLGRSAAVPLDYLASAESFSEVENARAAMEALAARYADEAQRRIAEEIMRRSGNFGIAPASGDRPMRSAIKLLDEVLPEFHGSGAELQLLQPLLYALKQERCYERWLEVYLDALYRHPTHRMVAELAGEAVAIGRATGREAELAAALRHLSDIPLASLDRARIELSLLRVGARIPRTSTNHACQL